MTIKQPLAILLLSSFTALGATACAPGIDVGQATTTGSSSGTTTGGVPDGSVNLPGLVIDPQSMNFGTVVTNTSATETLLVTNNSGASMSDITAVVSGTNAPWFTILGMPATLAANAQAAVDVQFRPLQPNVPARATLTVSVPGFDSMTLTLFGNSVAAATALALDPATINFGYVPLRTTVVECSDVTNKDNVSVTITGVTILLVNGGSFQTATTDDATPPNPFSLPLTIPAGGTGKVCFSFNPPIAHQCYAQAILLLSDPSAVNPVIQLNGSGGGPQISCTPLNLRFDPADAGPGSLSATCSNTGTAIPVVNLAFRAVTTSGPFASQFEIDPGVNGLAPGQSATIDVTYQPLVDAGTTGTLQINSNAGQGQPVLIPLSVFGG